MSDTARLLHRHSAHGYTSDPARAMPHEPEAIPAGYQHQLTGQARDRAHDRDRHDWQQARDRLQREIDWLYSQRFARDVHTQLRALDRQIARLDTRLTRQP